FVYDTFWYSGVLHLMFMSVNRYVSICASKAAYGRLFAPRRTLGLILAGYLVAAAISAPGLCVCCRLVYDDLLYQVKMKVRQNLPEPIFGFNHALSKFAGTDFRFQSCF